MEEAMGKSPAAVCSAWPHTHACTRTRMHTHTAIYQWTKPGVPCSVRCWWWVAILLLWVRARVGWRSGLEDNHRLPQPRKPQSKANVSSEDLKAQAYLKQAPEPSYLICHCYYCSNTYQEKQFTWLQLQKLYLTPGITCELMTGVLTGVFLGVHAENKVVSSEGKTSKAN